MNQRQSKKNLKNSMVLIDGNLIKKEAIISIEKREALPKHNLGPAIIINYKFGNWGDTIVINYPSDLDRNAQYGQLMYSLGW